MSERYPVPTQQDLDRDNVCIVCREEMSLQDDVQKLVPKKLKCGHCFHFKCLRSWLERQQSCPTWYNLLTSRASVFTDEDNASNPPTPLHAFPPPNVVADTPRNSHTQSVPATDLDPHGKFY